MDKIELTKMMISYHRLGKSEVEFYYKSLMNCHSKYKISLMSIVIQLTLIESEFDNGEPGCLSSNLHVTTG